MDTLQLVPANSWLQVSAVLLRQQQDQSNSCMQLYTKCTFCFQPRWCTTRVCAIPPILWCRWSLGVTLWQMVAGSLPDWAEAQTHHNTTHTAQQQQELAAVHTTEEALMLPLEPATACHTTPQDLQFPDTFSQVGTSSVLHVV